MTLKLLFAFSQDRYTWTEAQYLLTASVLSSGVGPGLQYAALRTPCLGNLASLDFIRISEVPANRLVEEIDSELFAHTGTWPADPSNDVFASDRAYSSFLLRMAGSISSKNWFFAGVPDSVIQTVSGFRPGYNLAAAAGFGSRIGAFLAYLVNGGNWGFRSRTAAGQLQSQSPPMTNALFPAMVGIVTAATLGLNIGDSVVLTKWRRQNPRIKGLSGVWRIGGVLPPVAPATNWTYFLLNSGNVSPTNFLTIGTIGPLSYQYVPYEDWSFIRSVSHKRGGSYALPRGRSRVGSR